MTKVYRCTIKYNKKDKNDNDQDTDIQDDVIKHHSKYRKCGATCTIKNKPKIVITEPAKPNCFVKCRPIGSSCNVLPKIQVPEKPKPNTFLKCNDNGYCFTFNPLLQPEPDVEPEPDVCDYPEYVWKPDPVYKCSCEPESKYDTSCNTFYNSKPNCGCK